MEKFFLLTSLCFPLLAMQFGTHDVVVLKPNKADLGSPALGQGVVYRLKDSSIRIAFDDIPEDGLNNPLYLEKVANEVCYSEFVLLPVFS
ncbi:hypothetical protein GOBAR_DD15707 [Gossypium barbadense]|nr:hypothetical protein GOBAR_DD15707 [Gossypium barbadense]